MFRLFVGLGFFLFPLLHQETGGGAWAGFLHPLLGLDHLLAMVTVGMLSAQMGGRSIWTVPTVFVLMMIVGGILGILGIGLPLVELGIAASVVMLGIALAAKQALPIALVMTFVGLFGIFHGHAHGTELPTVADSTLYVFSYIVGFVVATAGLHVIGALLGTMAARTERGERNLRTAGAIIAVMGIGILFGVI
jgi:urease accessory protein